MLPPPCLTVGTLLLEMNASPLFLQIYLSWVNVAWLSQIVLHVIFSTTELIHIRSRWLHILTQKYAIRFQKTSKWHFVKQNLVLLPYFDVYFTLKTQHYHDIYLHDPKYHAQKTYMDVCKGHWWDQEGVKHGPPI